MGRRALLFAAGGLLLGGGVLFALLGFRSLDLERLRAVVTERERVERLLDAAAKHALRQAEEPSAPPSERWLLVPLRAGAPPRDGTSEGALLLAEAAHAERREDGAERALGVLTRLARDPGAGDWHFVAAARGAALAARLEQATEATRLARVALDAPASLHDPDGLPVRRLALYRLAVLDLRAGRTEAVGPFLDDAEGGRLLSPAERVGADDLVLALRREAANLPSIAQLEAAAGRVLAGHRFLAALEPGGVRVLDGRVVLRRGEHLEARGLSTLLAGFEAGGGESPRLVPRRSAASEDLVRLALRPPLEGYDLVARPASPPAAHGARLALALGLAVWLLGTTLALVAIRRSQRAARMQADFVAAVSHELKTPIASVRAMAEFIADDPQDDAERTRDYARRIESEMTRLGATVRNVLDVARIERQGRLPVRLEAGEPADVVEAVAHAFGPTLEARGFAFDLRVRSAGRDLAIDDTALQSALMNLLDNAAKFSTAEKAIDLVAGPEDGVYGIEVRDRGRGIPAGEEDRLFGRFVRDDGVRSDAVPGVGLGLYVVRQILSAHQGTVRARARSGGGSVFRIELPMPVGEETAS